MGFLFLSFSRHSDELRSSGFFQLACPLLTSGSRNSIPRSTKKQRRISTLFGPPESRSINVGWSAYSGPGSSFGSSVSLGEFWQTFLCLRLSNHFLYTPFLSYTFFVTCHLLPNFLLPPQHTHVCICMYMWIETESNWLSQLWIFDILLLPCCELMNTCFPLLR